MRMIMIIATIMIFTSCTVSRYSYAPAKITTYKGRIKIDLLEKLKPMPDTTVYGIYIKKN